MLIIVLAFSGKNNNSRLTATRNENKISLVKKYDLPDLLTETSGLIYYHGLVWTFNDSGGEPELYGYSMKDTAVVQRLTLWNGKNYDWEEVTQDSSSIYIGDTGNNFGNRDNFCIYKIDKKDIPASRKNKAIKASKIHYTYPGYTPMAFSFKTRSAFDCEAMICYNDSIYLFTKNWTNQTSSIYQLPDRPGRYLARKIGEFNSEGLITAATYFQGSLYLLGYGKGIPFLWKFTKIHQFALKTENGIRYDLKMLAGAQAEGITFINAHSFLISAEGSTKTARIFIMKQ
jgi:hypothetical protein